MHIEQLAKPRIKVIADFWDNPFDVGDIIQFESYSDYHDPLSGDLLGKDWVTDFIELKKPYRGSKGSVMWSLRGFTPYPHLFSKLEWFEQRSDEVILQVKYVRFGDLDKAHAYYEIIKRLDDDSTLSFWEMKSGDWDYCYPLSRSIPATEEEYINYCKTKKK